MAKKVEYVINRSGTAALARSADMARICEAAGRRVERSARAMPVARVGKRSDRAAYQDSFKTVQRSVHLSKAKDTKDRAGALVINDHHLERVFGSRNHTLYRALSALNGVRVQ